MVQIALSLMAATLFAPQHTDKVTKVSFTDVGRSVQIIGQYGKPPGTVLKLEGRRVGNSKGPSKMGGGNFRIERIDGVPLKEKSIPWIEEILKLPEGTRCTIEAYETGSMIGSPPGAIEHGAPIMQAVWQFKLDLVVVKVLR